MSEELTTAELREMASSDYFTFGTSAPYAMGDVVIEKVGFGSIPMVNCREQDIRALVPVVRQKVFRFLAAAGVPDTVLQFSPRVGEIRRRERFVDENPSSPSRGKNKFGACSRFSFEIVPSGLGYFEFGWRGSTWSRGRVRKETTDE